MNSQNYSLTLSAEEMRALGYRAIDIIVEHLVRIREEPAVRTASRAELEARLREPLPERGTDQVQLLERVQRDVLSTIAHPDHPRFFAYVPGPSNFVGIIADLLASGFNAFAGTWLSGSAAVEIELLTLDWLKQICG